MTRHRYNVLTRLRDIHFLNACREARRQTKGYCTAAAIAARAAAMPAPCYYVSPQHALRTIRAYRRHGRLPCAGRPTGAMWLELARRVAALQRRRRITDRQALQRILNEGNASSFFLAPATALRLFYMLNSSCTNIFRTTDQNPLNP